MQVMFIEKLNSRWLALSKRERWMIFGAGLIAVVGLMDTFLLEPQRVALANGQQELNKIQTDTAALSEQMGMLAEKTALNKSAHPYQAEIDAIHQKIEAQSSDLLKVAAFMVPPEEMVTLLKRLLEKNAEVQVVEMQSLPAVDFIEKQKKLVQTQNAVAHTPESSQITIPEEAWQQVPRVYQHAVKLKLKGKYFALLSYAQSLKMLGKKIAWESAELKSEYPESELTVQLYTLSGQNTWLGI